MTDWMFCSSVQMIIPPSQHIVHPHTGKPQPAKLLGAWHIIFIVSNLRSVSLAKFYFLSLHVINHIIPCMLFKAAF